MTELVRVDVNFPGMLEIKLTVELWDWSTMAGGTFGELGRYDPEADGSLIESIKSRVERLVIWAYVEQPDPVEANSPFNFYGRVTFDDGVNEPREIFFSGSLCEKSVGKRTSGFVAVKWRFGFNLVERTTEVEFRDSEYVGSTVVNEATISHATIQ